LIFLSIASIFDGDGDYDECVIVTTRSFARAILDCGIDFSIWTDGELTEPQSEAIEAGIASVTTALNE